MKYFKKFFTMITNTGKKIYNSKAFEIGAFVFDSVDTTVEWAKKTGEFIDQMKLVIASIAIVGKYLYKAVTGIFKNHKVSIA